MQADWPILSVLLWLPIAAGVLLLLHGERNHATARWLALVASVATFVISVLLWRGGDVAVIDGAAVNGSARLVGWVASAVRGIQSGYLYHYAFATIIGLSLIAVVYIGFVALVQQDMKKLIAYSSIAHMGFVTLGSFAAYQIFNATGSVSGAAMGLDGAMVQMISHGLVSGALFFSIGVLYDRMHSRQIADYGGVVNLSLIHI